MKSKRVAIYAAAALVLVGLAGAHATGRLAAEPTATAVIDLERVFESLKEKQQLDAELQTQRERLGQEQEQMRQKAEQLQADLDMLVPGTEAYQQKQDEYESAAIERQVWVEVEQRKLSRLAGTSIEQLYRNTLDSISRLASEEGYDLVLYKETEPQFNYETLQQLLTQIGLRKVLYSNEAVDLTERVIQRMNNEYDAAN